MKSLFKYMFAGLLAGTVLSSCSSDQLETQPTTSMSGASLMDNGNAALVPLNGIYRMLYTAGWSTGGNTHQCHGITAWTLCAEVMGEDHIMADQGNGWYWNDAIYNVKSRYTSTAWRSYDLWNAYYTLISNANYILAAEETMKDGATVTANSALGQAYAIRAYSYFMLAQNFARTYKGHESEPCCPIYTEPTSADTKGQPRSTVQQVYDLIKSDINKAVELLANANCDRQHISHIDYSVACGIQARIALVMEDWATAKTAAHNAIKSSGKNILPVADFIGVNDVKKGNVMWGAEIITDQVGMYASFFSHMDADMGAYGESARKQINKLLYAKMNPTDTRQAWWNPQDANNKSNGYQQEKFKFSDYQTWLGDYIFMRIEEMYLIAAEAECRLNQENEAKADLMELMSKRDTGYTCNKTGTALGKTTCEWTGSLLEEILIQRRIELWGEAGRVFDIKRCKQGFVRTAEMGWPTKAMLDGRPTDDPENYMWVLTIPQTEFDGNENMDGEKDQNPVGDTK